MSSSSNLPDPNHHPATATTAADNRATGAQAASERTMSDAKPDTKGPSVSFQAQVDTYSPTSSAAAVANGGGTSTLSEDVSTSASATMPAPTNSTSSSTTTPTVSAPDGQSTLAEGSKKTSRLQWDEENLMLNAAEMERAGPRMKIDEPKTPFNATENGSSASESVQQSPPESPSFIPTDRLVGFGALEQNIGGSGGGGGGAGVGGGSGGRGSGTGTNSAGSGSGGGGGGSTGIGGGNMSDGASSVGSGGRSVHISDDNLGASAGSSPRSRERFALRRRAHYRNEARVVEWMRLREADEDEDDEDEDDEDANGDVGDFENNENTNSNTHRNMNSNNLNPEDVVREVSDRLVDAQPPPHAHEGAEGGEGGDADDKALPNDSAKRHVSRPDNETNGYSDDS